MRTFLIFILVITGFILIAQNPEADALKKQMTTIRQNTNWKDKEEAAKANQEISKLSKQLMMMNAVKKPQGEGDGQAQYSDEPAPGQTTEENVELKMKLWEQLWGTARRGKDAELDLAKPVRDEIVEAYREDSDPTIKSPDFLQSMPLLIIDMSMPGVDKVIEQMPMFRGIRFLIITTQESYSPVDLDDILEKAGSYPLEELTIINFKNVNALPDAIAEFTGLRSLSIFNNSLYQLPPTLSGLANLETLYLDTNPIASVAGIVQGMHSLKMLGIARTNISDSEIQHIQTLLPECQILTE